jgi:hypothetical protein
MLLAAGQTPKKKICWPTARFSNCLEEGYEYQRRFCNCVYLQ